MLTLLQDVAEEVIDPRFRALSEGQVMEKNPGDLVTVADHEAEVLLTAALREAYPGAVVLGEEAHSADPSVRDVYDTADHAFTVDPVDGTKNFVGGSPDHAVMVGEVRGGEVVRSWIWHPQHRTAYLAERGGGAWRVAPDRSWHRLVRPATPPPSRLRGVTSRRRWLGRSLGELPPLELTWICCGVDYPRLAEGAADVILYGSAQPWDHVPGALLLAEAGAWLGNLDGSPFRAQGATPSGLVAAADEATYRLVVDLLAR